jgi:alginate O-acetyltransferase complex protein AlgI
MVFSSVVFLFLFLPIVLIVYYISPNRFKNLVLFVVSLIFYAWGEGKLVLLLLFSSLLSYTFGLLIEKKEKKKLLLIFSVIINLLILGFFKYLNFTFDNLHHLLNFFHLQSDFILKIPQIALPIGISFYTFQAISYTIDVYRGKIQANRNFIDFATYICMFPQLVAGPIIRYADISGQLKKRKVTFETFSIGIERFIIGLAKKVLIANTFASIANYVFVQNIHDLATPMAWLGIISYTIQIYYDFSGYSDMAIGLGKMFGLDFLENFNFPYISKNIREFWRRWHISLSLWFKDYVYISLGGNRKGSMRTYFNLFMVFFVTGLWHGPSWTFIVWGLFHGLFMVIERLGFGKVLDRLWRPIQHVYTLLIIIVAWVFFRADTISDAFLYLEKMFYYSTGSETLNSYLLFFNVNPHAIFFFLIAVIFCCPVYTKIRNKYLVEKYQWLHVVLLFALFFISVVYLSVSLYNPFIYFRF